MTLTFENMNSSSKHISYTIDYEITKDYTTDELISYYKNKADEISKKIFISIGDKQVRVFSYNTYIHTLFLTRV